MYYNFEKLKDRVKMEIFRGFDMTQFVISFIAILQGLLGLSDLAMSYLYKDDLNLSPAQVSMTSSLAVLPWVVKPLWGFISDSFPIFGFRRKSYLILFGILNSLSWVLMAFTAHTLTGAVLLATISSCSMSFMNVIGEALMVEKSQGHHQSTASKNVSIFFGVKSVGMITTAYLSGLLLEYLNKRIIFLITSTFPIILVVSAFFIEESRVDHVDSPGISSQVRQLWSFVGDRRILSPMIFIFLFTATPSTGDSMFFFYTNHLGFTPEFMGRLRLAYGVATLLGIFMYHKLFKNMDFRKVLLWTTIAAVCIGSTQLLLVTRANVAMGIPDKLFTLGDGLIIQAMGEVQTMPLLVLAARLCPPGVEGSVYALLMSTINLGGLVSSQLGGLLSYLMGITSSQFTLLWLLVLITNVCMLLPLPLLILVPSGNSDSFQANITKQYQNAHMAAATAEGDDDDRPEMERVALLSKATV
eukprot:GILI01012265.1.p1 GENE.GILI01012265.1~~GILI01012265.1.p1  ORF type:complete len:471 (+),score=118.94 GILI01012265.1:179-1591(+)